MELVLSGEMIAAEDAHRSGLFNRVVLAATLMTETQMLGRKLAATSPDAVSRAKRSM